MKYYLGEAVKKYKLLFKSLSPFDPIAIENFLTLDHDLYYNHTDSIEPDPYFKYTDDNEVNFATIVSKLDNEEQQKQIREIWHKIVGETRY